MNDAHSGRYGGPEDGQDPYTQDPYTQDPYPPQAPYQQQYYDPAYDPAYDPYAQQQPEQQPGQQQGYGYGPYGQGAGQDQRVGQQQQQPQYDQYGYPYDPYAPQPQQQGYDYDPYGQVQQARQAPPTPQAPQVQQLQERQRPQQSQQADERQQWIPQPPPQQEPRPEPRPEPPPEPFEEPGRARVPGPREDPEAPEYRTEQFAFVEDPDEESDDVIDWLKFAETRSERRDERKRKGRNRVVGLVVVLVLALTGGVGYLWSAGKLPGLPGSDPAADSASGPQKRDVIVVHLRDTKGRGSASALLVDNATTKKGTTVLLPNSVAVSTDDGRGTTLGKSVEDEGNSPTRGALNTLLGADIKGSWRLDTPYLENLVELVGGITLDTDAAVPAPRKGEDPLAERGKQQALGGQAAVGYATLLRGGETQTDQLRRFGQVMQAVLKKVPSDPGAATTTVRNLGQIPDPSLSESELGATLAQLAEQAKNGSYDTMMLPVQSDGTLSARATDTVVEKVLGGTVKSPDGDAAPRVSVQNATGNAQATGTAQVALVNGGYSFVDGGAAGAARAASRVTYADAAQKAKATEVAKTLGLPESVVAKGTGASNADVTVVLGQDYKAE